VERRPRLQDDDLVADLFVRSLIRSQLGLSLRLAAAYAVVLGGLPLLFALVPQTRTQVVLGLPLPWLVLGVLVPPLLLGGALLYVRLAERTEQEFVELVERS
jgi:hypothetical protein